MPQKKRSRTEGGDSSGQSGRRVKPSVATPVRVKDIISYARSLARDPSTDKMPLSSFSQHKSLVNKVFAAFYKGPDLGKKSGKRGRDTKKRPCSPSLFREHNSFEASVPGSPARFSERGRRKQERSAPIKRLEEYLSFVSRTYYKAPAVTASVPDSAHGTGGSSSSVVSIGDLFPTTTAVKTSTLPGRYEKPELTLQRHSTIGVLQNPARKAYVLDLWTPFEIALFESGICVYGKDFHAIHKVIKSKSTKEVIEFYYFWKKSSHYSVWKRNYE